jgi:hypothetical protein
MSQGAIQVGASLALLTAIGIDKGMPCLFNPEIPCDAPYCDECHEQGWPHMRNR